MNISGVNGTNSTWPAGGASAGQVRPQESASRGAITVPQDQLDISPAARMMMELANLDPKNVTERTELINRIRAEIANGTYDTEEKLEQALEKFIAQHGSQDD